MPPNLKSCLQSLVQNGSSELGAKLKADGRMIELRQRGSQSISPSMVLLSSDLRRSQGRLLIIGSGGRRS